MIQKLKNLLGQKTEENDLAILESSKANDHKEEYQEPAIEKLNKEKKVCACGDEECECNKPGHVCQCQH